MSPHSRSLATSGPALLTPRRQRRISHRLRAGGPLPAGALPPAARLPDRRLMQQARCNRGPAAASGKPTGGGVHYRAAEPDPGEHPTPQGRRRRRRALAGGTPIPQECRRDSGRPDRGDGPLSDTYPQPDAHREARPRAGNPPRPSPNSRYTRRQSGCTRRSNTLCGGRSAWPRAARSWAPHCRRHPYCHGHPSARGGPPTAMTRRRTAADLTPARPGWASHL